jgi:CheY-like chemotaxis protein
VNNAIGPFVTGAAGLTTTDDKTEIQRCYDLGCNDYITKPVNYENFAVAIRQLGLFLSVMQVPEQT